jgi:hypothetical protein
VVESIAVVSTPCLDRLILWEVRGSPNPASGLRTRIKIGIAPKLRILGYLDPAQHLLEIGGTVIMVLLLPPIVPFCSLCNDVEFNVRSFLLNLVHCRLGLNQAQVQYTQA